MTISPEFCCYILGGYCGKFGSVTATKTFTLPFVPFDGLGIVLDGQPLYVMHDTDGDGGLPIEFDVKQNRFFFHVECVDDYMFEKCKTIEQITRWYTDHDWEVLSSDKEKELK